MFLECCSDVLKGQRKGSESAVKKDWLRRETGVVGIVGTSGELKTCNKINGSKFCCTWL